jgi:predicted secreted protein
MNEHIHRVEQDPDILGSAGGVFMTLQFLVRRMTAGLVLSTGMILASGCTTVPQGVSSNATIVGLADSGALVRLAPEQELVVKLNANMSNGFKWRIEKSIDQSVLLADGSKISRSSQQRSRGDEVGTQLLRFIAQQPGRTRLNLVYTNVQQGLIEGTPKYSVEVIVAPKPTPPEQQ